MRSRRKKNGILSVSLPLWLHLLLIPSAPTAIITGCGDETELVSRTRVEEAPTLPEIEDEPFVPQGHCLDGTPYEANGFDEKSLTRVYGDGFTTVSAIYCNPLMPGDPGRAEFYVRFSNHAGVPPIDLKRSTWLETGSGLRVEQGFEWDGADLMIADHHASGFLSVPAQTGDGNDWMATGTAWIGLHFGDLGPTEIYLRWESDVLSASRAAGDR